MRVFGIVMGLAPRCIGAYLRRRQWARLLDSARCEVATCATALAHGCSLGFAYRDGLAVAGSRRDRAWLASGA